MSFCYSSPHIARVKKSSTVTPETSDVLKEIGFFIAKLLASPTSPLFHVQA